MNRPKRENIMLAYPVDPGRISRLGEKFFVQPKLNGERCRIEWFHGEPVMVSSYGNVYKGLDHIQHDIIKLDSALGGKRNIPFDGELYVHGWTWSQIRSVASREVNIHPKAGLLEYHIFDIQDTAPQVSRFSALNLAFKSYQGTVLQQVPTYICTQGNQWDYAARFIDDGYEGIILRAPVAPYHLKRNVCLLKYKPTESDEYQIVDVLEALALDGTPKFMVGAFLVQSDDGVVFKVGAGKMKHSERTELWQKRQILTGLTLIVKHEKLRTVNEVPIAAVALSIKEKINA